MIDGDHKLIKVFSNHGGASRAARTVGHGSVQQKNSMPLLALWEINREIEREKPIQYQLALLCLVLGIYRIVKVWQIIS